MARIKSTMFISARKGTPGRQATRWLSDEAVRNAKVKNKDIQHRMKFMSPLKRFATALSMQA